MTECITPLPGPVVTFWAKAPDEAPDEVRGTNCYFKPERLEWRVRAFRLGDERIVMDVVAHGPATRVPFRQGLQHWYVMGTPGGDTRPPWLLLPTERLARAKLLVQFLQEAGR